jgi:SNF2 family DNA or RNA helicase
LLSCLITILENHPIFYEKNFRDILDSFYKYWQIYAHILKNHHALGKETERYARKSNLSEEEIFIKKWNYSDRIDSVHLEVDKNYSVEIIIKSSDKHFNKNSSFPIMKFLRDLPNALLHKLCPNLRFIHTVYQCTLSLLEKSAIIPQILQNDKNLTVIRWIPALFNENVKDICVQLSNTCPDDFVIYNGKHLSADEQIKTAISWLIGQLFSKHKSADFIRYEKVNIFRLFFYGKKIYFNNFSDKEIPNLIKQWLSKLYISEKSYKLYLKVIEKSEGFVLTAQISPDNLNSPIPIKKALEVDDTKKRLDILSDLSLIAHYLPEFDSIVQSNSGVYFTIDDFTPLFLDILPALQAIGVIVMLPKSLQKNLKPKINLVIKSKEKVQDYRPKLLSLKNIMTFNWKVSLGNQLISVEEFTNKLNQSGKLVKIMDNYVLLSEKELENFLKEIKKLPNALSYDYLFQAMLAEEMDDIVVSFDDNIKNIKKSFSKYHKLSIPDNLQARLRPYQERGFNWLIQNIFSSFGSILADDMGLGKTIQVIAVLLYLKNNEFIKNEQRVLIVVPTGLLSNWVKEFEKFAPDIKICLYHGNNREFLSKECDVVLTSYGLARSEQTELKKKKWYIVVIDEAQNIKNPYSKQTKAIKSIYAMHKIAMSGTPVENRLLEYWSIFDFANQMYLGTLKQFKKRYAFPIEAERNKNVLDRFKKITAPFMLRRLKSDKSIIADLPEKMETNRYCQLTADQAALYQKVIDNNMKKLEKSEGITRKGLVLQLINALKQICNHPALFIKKQQKLSFEQSGKMLMLEEILSEMDNIGEKCLIFTQYVEMGEILTKILSEKMNIHVPFLHGGLSRVTRDKMVSDFQNPMSNIRFFIISLKAGGTGLNLTSANHVIHYDLWWNPAVENQATDRSYRIGQQRNVIVHRFITAGTFEERIDEMIKSKKELADLTISTKENWITEMTTKELKKLVDLKNTVT